MQKTFQRNFLSKASKELRIPRHLEWSKVNALRPWPWGNAIPDNNSEQDSPINVHTPFEFHFQPLLQSPQSTLRFPPIPLVTYPAFLSAFHLARTGTRKDALSRHRTCDYVTEEPNETVVRLARLCPRHRWANVELSWKKYPDMRIAVSIRWGDKEGAPGGRLVRSTESALPPLKTSPFRLYYFQAIRR